MNELAGREYVAEDVRRVRPEHRPYSQEQSNMLGPQPTRAPAVPDALNRLSCALSELHDVVGALRNRLEPVLGPDQPAPTGEQGVNRSAPGLAEIIGGHAAGIEVAAAHVRNMIRRLEI